jgi:hypothetical protein
MARFPLVTAPYVGSRESTSICDRIHETLYYENKGGDQCALQYTEQAQ